jgi:hypothetical protein
MIPVHDYNRLPLIVKQDDGQLLFPRHAYGFARPPQTGDLSNEL